MLDGDQPPPLPFPLPLPPAWLALPPDPALLTGAAAPFPVMTPADDPCVVVAAVVVAAPPFAVTIPRPYA